MKQTFYPISQQAEFLNALFSRKDGAFVELRLLPEPEGDRVFTDFYDSLDGLVDALPKTIEQQKGYGVFVGVCPRSERNGKKVSIKMAYCLWIDLDAKDFKGGKEEAWQRLSEFPLCPTLIVDSGNGYHAYWLLDMPVPIQSQADIAKIEGFNRRLAGVLNGDFQSTEIARVLRLPGSWNLKDSSCPLPVKICEVEPDRRYSLTDFDWLPQIERERPLTNGKANGASHLNPALNAAIARIKEKADIVAIIGRRIALDSNLKARCPFHPDTNPSFSIHPQGRYFHCFGCGAGGDVFTFLERFEKKQFMEVVSQLAQETGISLPTSSKSEKSDVKEIYTARFEGLVDLVEHEGKVAFLVKENDNLLILPHVERDGERYLPPPQDQILWLLPRGEEVLKHYSQDSDAALWNDLLRYFQSVSDLPREGHYHLLTAWVFHTYLMEKVRYSPYIWFYADADSGKTRTGKAMVHVSYRGFHVESLTDAHIIRWANNLGATLFLDVMDIWKRATEKDSQDILLQRCEKGLKVGRVLHPELGAFRDTKYFDVFGATVIATNEGVHETLGSRAVQINIQASNRRFDGDVTPELALPLKERLVAFRARHLDAPLPDIPKLASRRLGDILRPLHQMVRLVNKEQEQVFLDLVRQLEDVRLAEKAGSLQAEILKAVVSLQDKVVWIGGVPVLAVQLVAQAVNARRAEKAQFSEKTIGRRLTEMGFQVKRLNDGSAGRIYDESYIERLKDKYGLREISETSVTSAQYQSDEEAM